MTTVVIGIPVKPFGAAKRRLADVLDAAGRARLGRELAERTVKAVIEAGAAALVLSADEQVTEWAQSIGVDVLLDEGSSLDQAAGAALIHIRAMGAAWAVLHADVPTLRSRDLSGAVLRLGVGGSVIAPSSDGGTSLVGSSLDEFRFAYGAGSFHRHLAALAGTDPQVIVNRGLALDLDTPDDLRAASGRPEGRWLAG
ncbi:MAG: 2-phospho-L-lactate guanylyltransferase [Acidimicrobiia bacterium]